jgi:hypothetical protein
LLVALKTQGVEAMLQDLLQGMEDTRRKQGRRYDVGNVIYCCILAALSGATSYRKMSIFIQVHFEELRKNLGLNWKKAPSYVGIRKIVQGVNPESLENLHREYTKKLLDRYQEGGSTFYACDGKTLRGSFDHVEDKKAMQILSIFCHETHIVLGQSPINEKSNEIPAFQHMLETLEITGKVFTLDALHLQKKR